MLNKLQDKLRMNEEDNDGNVEEEGRLLLREFSPESSSSEDLFHPSLVRATVSISKATVSHTGRPLRNKQKSVDPNFISTVGQRGTR